MGYKKEQDSPLPLPEQAMSQTSKRLQRCGIEGEAAGKDHWEGPNPTSQKAPYELPNTL